MNCPLPARSACQRDTLCRTENTSDFVVFLIGRSGFSTLPPEPAAAAETLLVLSVALLRRALIAAPATRKRKQENYTEVTGRSVRAAHEHWFL